MVDKFMNTDLQQLEQGLENAKKLVDLGNALDRLKANKDFQLLITNGYLKDEAVRLVHLKADPNMQTPERQASVIRDIDSIGALTSYLNLVYLNADRALRQIDVDSVTRDEILSEGN